ncbi:hypothetical protein [Desulforhopalus sp. IMCC35007]|uniref:hypothetical protein n=1 Tax=Desulforhopalus sp. IMCC35007 TaxID=2569543 RepID=UPI0010AEB538|nr:hypothetical protein [Desulforhopalus sp. IMCC35007]TKB09393.1 hypothetical protein FCL48_10585 [Desulforhopalus sp. IMCC35007]
MGSQQNTSRTICPFWSTNSKKCRVCRDGLFIPLDDHIEAFCMSEDYHHCLQYSLHAPNEQQANHLANKNTGNRRQSNRIKLSNKIQLLKLIKSGEVIQNLAASAETLDFSHIGMRLLTTVPLIDDSVIQFSFSASFPAAIKTGAGVVHWCNKQIDGPGYQVGISFQSGWILEAMGRFLQPYSTNI